MAKYKMHVLICGGTGCKSSNSLDIIENFHNILKEKNLQDEVQVIKTGCFGFCEKGPIVKIMPDNTFYTQVKPEDVRRIVEEHLVKGRKVPELLYLNPENKEHVSDSKHMDFYKKQIRIALRNCGFVDPENIEECISRGGYEGLAKCLTEMTPEQVIAEMKASGLRGRGGAGFPTGLKWELCAKNKADQKYVICNADEGDPGAFMDRSILEGDPNSIVEAMAICGYAIGASKGLVYIRAEYPLAIERLKIAITQAREYGLLGDDILGTGFANPPPKTMLRPSPTFPSSSPRVLIGSTKSVPRNRRVLRCSPLPARLTTSALSRFPWASPSVRLSMRSVVASRMAVSSKPSRPVVLPVAA